LVRRKKGPTTLDEWADVEKYMGIFERINILINEGILDIDTVDELYGYRIINIAANEVVRKEKLEDRRDYWQEFIELYEKILENRNSH
jgi:hypothetical protein